MFEQQDPKTGLWALSPRLGTAVAIAKVRGRQLPESGRLVFAEMIGADGFVAPGYPA